MHSLLSCGAHSFPLPHIFVRPARVRMRCWNVVGVQVIQGDVDEALRLMRMSKISLEDEEQQDAVMNDPVRDAFSKVLPSQQCWKLCILR